MTDLEIFESLRPDVEPLSDRDRSGIRRDLFGSETPSGSADAGSVDAAVHYDLDRGRLRGDTRQSQGGRGLLSLAAVCLTVAGVAAIWFTVGHRGAADPAPAQQPASTTAESTPAGQDLVAPVWYDTIRPLLPDGFDQVVLTDATPEVVGFKAFRTGTRQLLDVTITLQPGYDAKDTGEAVTFSDEYGDYVESAGSIALTTPDERRVTIRCGLRPIGGGSTETGGLLDADRDSCDGSVDNLDLDPISRRSLSAKLADEFPTDIVTPGFGQPDTRPATTGITQIVDDFVGDDRPFGVLQSDGVLRLANLSPTLGEPATTELTVINGIWPPNGDGSAFDDTYADSPEGRFYQYGDIAAALVVVNGTGYHIATTDLSDTHLTALGELLQQLIAASPDTTSPVATAAPSNTTPGSTVATPAAEDSPANTVLAGSPLDRALRPDGRVLVVNASNTEGLAASLSDALALSGYAMLGPENAVDGAVADASTMYTHPDMPNSMLPTSIANAVPIGNWETLTDQPAPTLTQEMRDSADLIIVAGNDLADAPWLGASTPLIDPRIGRLLIIDATTTDHGHQAAAARADELRSAGVDIAGVVTATAALEQPMLMPIGEPTLWTFAIAELTDIGGFDTWTPRLVTGAIPDGVTAALAISN